MTTTRLLLPAVIATAAMWASAQQPATGGTVVVLSQPGKVDVANTEVVSATVVAIDRRSRTVTLKGPDGVIQDVVCGPAVKNFRQIRRGDEITVNLVQALTLELLKTGSNGTAWVEDTVTGAAKPGSKPGAAQERHITILANVVGVDAAAGTIVLKGPKGNVMVLPVRNRDQFKVVEVGDQVEAVYREAFAIAMVPVKR